MSDVIKIPNISKYNVTIENDELILTPKIEIVKNNVYTIDEFLQENINMKHSKIKKCIIKVDNTQISTNRTKFRKILIDIWKNIPAQRLLQTTTYNFKLTNEGKMKGYIWSDELNMSFQNKDSNGCLKEILHMSKINKYKIFLSIELKNKDIICIDELN